MVLMVERGAEEFAFSFLIFFLLNPVLLSFPLIKKWVIKVKQTETHKTESSCFDFAIYFVRG